MPYKADPQKDSINDLSAKDIELIVKHPQVLFDICGWPYYSKQKEIMLSVRDNQLTTVIACPDSGKTHTAAGLAHWVVNFFPGSKVIVVAPVARQVQDLFWAQFSAMYQSAPIQLLDTPQLQPYAPIKLTDSQGREVVQTDWFVRGITAREEAYTGIRDKLSGYHGSFIFIIMDQADGLITPVWQAMWMLRTSAQTRVLSLSNPLQPTSENANINIPERDTKFGEKFIVDGKLRPKDGKGWYGIKITAWDTPNVKAKKDIYPALYSYEHLQECIRVWPVTDSYYQMEIEANYVSTSEMVIFPAEMIHDMKQNEIAPDWDDISLGLDIAEMGADRSVLISKAGARLLRIRGVHGFDHIELSKMVAEEWVYIAQETERLLGVAKVPQKIYVDAIGVGSGVGVFLKHAGFPVVPVKVSRGVDEADSWEEDIKGKYRNQRAQVHWNVRLLGEKKSISLIPLWFTEPYELKLLFDEMIRIRYEYDGPGRIMVEEKKKLKSRVGHSPDNLDALCLAYCGYGGLPGVAVLGMKQEIQNVEKLFPDAETLQPANFLKLTDKEFDERFQNDIFEIERW